MLVDEIKKKKAEERRKKTKQDRVKLIKPG
jgi:hypothetical protein